ncbi:MAG: TIGR03936 family radical SAM-associated protein [Coriobacteriia bacterium]|nr:TIGR03936 family radical SAM-associated protein [Coriobacteriia bacterium]
MSTGEFRLRICYEKSGRLRWLSHLETVRAVERIIRRAGLRFALTKGFNPHIKVAFGPALPVGTASLCEYMDVWTTRYDEAGLVLALLQAVSPMGLCPVAAVYIPEREPALTVALTIGLYRVEVLPVGAGGRVEVGAGAAPVEVGVLEAALDELMAFGELTVERRGKKKTYDLSRSIAGDVRITGDGGDGGDGGGDGGKIVVEIPIRMGPEGALRPEVMIGRVLENVGVGAGAEVGTGAGSGATSGSKALCALNVTRTGLFVETDEGTWQRPM